MHSFKKSKAFVCLSAVRHLKSTICPLDSWFTTDVTTVQINGNKSLTSTWIISLSQETSGLIDALQLASLDNTLLILIPGKCTRRAGILILFFFSCLRLCKMLITAEKGSHYISLSSNPLCGHTLRLSDNAIVLCVCMCASEDREDTLKGNKTKKRDNTILIGNEEKSTKANGRKQKGAFVINLLGRLQHFCFIYSAGCLRRWKLQVADTKATHFIKDCK